MGYVLKENKPHGVTIKVDDKVQDFETLRVLEFSGERKRMSIIVKTPDNKIVMYSKGMLSGNYRVINYF
jgi:magnesium-transporting ATPase (P-type)